MTKKYIIITLLAIGISIIVFNFMLRPSDKNGSPDESVDEPFSQTAIDEGTLEKKEIPKIKEIPTRHIEGLPEDAQKYEQMLTLKFTDGRELEGTIKSIYGGLLRFQSELDGEIKEEEIKVTDLDNDSKQICTMWKSYELKYLPKLPYREWEYGRDEHDITKVVARLHAVAESGILLETADKRLHYVKKAFLNIETRRDVQKYSYDEEFFPMETKGKRAKQISSTGFHAFRWSKRFRDTGILKAVQYYVPDLRKLPADEKVPLVVFLHGLGESGTDNVKQFKWTGGFLFTTPDNQRARPCFMLAPQHLPTDVWSSQSITSPAHVCLNDAKNMILEMMHIYPQIDPNRIYITGLSSGGWGALEAVARWPELFAAVVSTAESCPARFFNRFNGRPMWMLYNIEPNAPGVPKDAHLIKENLEPHGIEVKITEYQQKNHRAWEPAYKTPGLHEWLFKQVKSEN